MRRFQPKDTFRTIKVPSKEAKAKNKEPKMNKVNCCNHCGEIGHAEAKCWTKKREEREAKVKGKKAKGKKGNNNHGQQQRKQTKKKNRKVKRQVENKELNLAGVSKINFPMTTTMLSDPNIWIGDTGATCNSTAFSEYMINVKEPNSSDNITYSHGR